MKHHHKITLASLATIIGIIAGLFTIIEKTPAVLAVISKASASEAPDTVEVKRGIAGEVNKEYSQLKAKGVK